MRFGGGRIRFPQIQFPGTRVPLTVGLEMLFFPNGQRWMVGAVAIRWGFLAARRWLALEPKSCLLLFRSSFLGMRSGAAGESERRRVCKPVWS